MELNPKQLPMDLARVLGGSGNDFTPYTSLIRSGASNVQEKCANFTSGDRLKRLNGNEHGCKSIKKPCRVEYRAEKKHMK